MWTPLMLRTASQLGIEAGHDPDWHLPPFKLPGLAIIYGNENP
jgi:hypothetical protein